MFVASVDPFDQPALATRSTSPAFPNSWLRWRTTLCVSRATTTPRTFDIRSRIPHVPHIQPSATNRTSPQQHPGQLIGALKFDRAKDRGRAFWASAGALRPAKTSVSALPPQCLA